MLYPILLPNIFHHPFTYESEISLKVGDYVLVPFGKSKITGVVWNEFEKNSNKKFIVFFFNGVTSNFLITFLVLKFLLLFFSNSSQTTPVIFDFPKGTIT